MKLPTPDSPGDETTALDYHAPMAALKSRRDYTTIIVSLIAMAIGAAAILVSCEANRLAEKARIGPQIILSEAIPPTETGPDGRVIQHGNDKMTVGNGDQVTFTTKEVIERRAPSSRNESEASAKGVGLKTSSEKVAQTFKAEQAKVGLEDVGGAEGGGFTYSGQLSGLVKFGLNIFHLIGAALLLAALAFVVVPPLFSLPPRTSTATTVGAGGVVFIIVGVSISSAPWVWVVALIALLGGLGFWLYKSVKAGHLEAFAKTVANTVDKLPDEQKEAMKDAIGAEAKNLGTGKSVLKVTTEKKIAGKMV